MKLNSVGFQTDLIFTNDQSEVLNFSEYLVIKTLMNPNHCWGNYMILNYPFCEWDVDYWKNRFYQSIKSKVNCKHFAFSWMSKVGDSRGEKLFQEKGFTLTKLVVLTKNKNIQEKELNDEIKIKIISDEKYWLKVLKFYINTVNNSSEETQVESKKKQMLHYRHLVKKGLGLWFGAFHNKKIIGSLGIFTYKNFSRFQQIRTHINYRNRGIGSALIYTAIQNIQERKSINEFVVVAEENSKAERFYKNLGFIEREKQICVSLTED